MQKRTKRQRHPLYLTWRGMRGRCENPAAINFLRYGGRGITVCERWKKFENFLSDMGARPEGMTLDRIDNNGNYEPGNCRWATRKEQCANRRGKGSRHIVEFNGKYQSIKQWAIELGMSPRSLYRRIVSRQWPVAEAFALPLGSTLRSALATKR